MRIETTGRYSRGGGKERKPTAPALTQQNFPSMPKPKQPAPSRALNNNNNQPNHSSALQTVEQQLPTLSSIIRPKPHAHTSQQAEGDLFSMEELLALSTELIAELQHCTTKLQQFQAINRIAIKFVYNNVK